MYKMIQIVFLRIMSTGIVALTLVWAGMIEPTPVLSQAPPVSCETLIQDAITLVGTSCAGLGRNEACYGHTLVAATFQEDTSALRFETHGDVIPLIDLQALVTRPADPDAGTWGVALMKVQADLPDESSAALTLVLFGDTEVTNRVADAEVPVSDPTCIVSNQGGSNINVRGGPGTGYSIVDVLMVGDEVSADGRNAAGDWVRITLDGGCTGWIYAPLVAIDGDVEILAVVEGEAETTATATSPRPMQAFTLRTGQTTMCEEAPDGLLIDAYPGDRATVIVNGVRLTFGSAAFLTAIPDDVLTIVGLSGSIDVTAFDQTVTVTARQQATVPLVGLEAAGPPSIPVSEETRHPAHDLLSPIIDIEMLPAIEASGTGTAESPAVDPFPTESPFVPGTYIETLTVTDLFLPDGCELVPYFPSLRIADSPDAIGEQEMLEVYLTPSSYNTFERTVYVESNIFGTDTFDGFGGKYWALNDLPCRVDDYEIHFTSPTTYDFTMRSETYAHYDEDCEGGYRLIEGTGVWQPEGEGEFLAGKFGEYDVNACHFIGKPPDVGRDARFFFETWSCNYETSADMEQYTVSIDIDGEPLEMHQFSLTNEYDYRWGLYGNAVWTATPGTHTVTAVSDYPCDGNPGADLTICTFTIP